MIRTASIVLAILAAACGGLGNPDLGTGEVRGRIVGGTSAGYVYPVGRPDLKAPLAADGTFRVRAPAGAGELVVVDGQPVPVDAPYGRAGRIPVEVTGAEITVVPDRDRSQLPVASAVLAGVRAESGAGCKDPRFQAALLRLAGPPAATDQDQVVSSGVPAALLTPLPPGDYQLSVSMSGFRTELRPFALTDSPQTLSFDLTLSVDDDEAEKGCEVTSCESSELQCCHDGDECDHAGWCYVTGGGAQGSCGAACSTSGNACQAGLSCSDGACVPPGGASACAAYLSTVGTACLSSSTCNGGVTGLGCYGRSDDHAGVCTASCDVDADCAAFPSGWTCDHDRHVCRLHD